MAFEGRMRFGVADLSIWLPGVGFAVLLGLLAWVSRSWTAPIMALAVLALGAYFVRVLGFQVGLVLMLVVTSFVDRYTFRAGPVDIRAEQVAAAAAVVALVVQRLRERDWSWLRPSAAEVLLLAWLAVNVLSSLLASPDRKLSAKIIALIAVSALGFALPRRILKGPEAAQNFEVLTRWMLLVFATESLAGALLYLLHVFGPTIALAVNPASGHLAAYGTLWEQNVFGAFAGAGAIAWVYLGPSRFKNAWIGVAVCLGGLLDSFTRAAYLATAIVGGIGAVLPGLRRRISFPLVGMAGLATLPFVVATLVVDRVGQYTIVLQGAPGPKPSLLTQLLNIVDVVGRVNQWIPVADDLRGHLLFGHGTASFEAIYVNNGVPQHIASLPLLILNDTGLVGLAVFGAFAAAIVARVWSRRHVPMAVVYGQMAIVIGLANVATQTTELMVGWLLIGLLMAAADHAQPEDSTAG